MKIGIGILTTPNRGILEQTLPEWYKYLPKDSRLIVENDTEYTGVARTTNRLLAQLDKFEHIFIVNDDVKPLVKDWYLPYIKANVKHLMYQFRLHGKPHTDMQVLYEDDKIKAYTHTRGCFLYIHRSLLDVMGGFDEAYGQAMYEHTDFTNRVSNSGLVPFRAADVVDSHKLLYCYDQDSEIESSIPESVRRRNLVKNRGLYLKSRTSREYRSYK